MSTNIFRPFTGDGNPRMPPGSGPGPGSGGPGITMNGPSSEPKFETKVEPSDESSLVPNEILDLFPSEPSSDTPTPKNEPVQCGMCQKQVSFKLINRKYLFMFRFIQIKTLKNLFAVIPVQNGSSERVLESMKLLTSSW